MNNLVLVGRLVEKNNISIISVKDNIKNEDILIKVDFGNGKMFDSINEYCNINDIVGIKGKLGKDNMVLVEKVSFLSSNNKE